MAQVAFSEVQLTAQAARETVSKTVDEIADYSAAIARARTLDWSHYPYTAIVVPGIGPDDLDVSLSARGKLNVRLAAARFAQGLAPFTLVSGGRVHPRGTHYAEALEMRRALMERFGIPGDCIVVDPYARHTTTNLCNAVPEKGDLGVMGALRITPGDPDTSLVSLRMHRRDAMTQMPQIGTNEVDQAGVGVIDEWITSLTGCP